MFDEATIRRTMVLLYADALGRGMPELSMVYGWSAIRLGNIMIEQNARDLARRWGENGCKS